MQYQFTPDDFAASHVYRFWSRVERSGSHWVWTGPRYSNGYGLMTIGYAHRSAHRYMAALVFGLDAVNSSPVVCHRCDWPLCVHPVHIFLDDQSGNLQDALRKGRLRPNGSKLTPDAVRTIRSADLSCHGARSAMARDYQVSLPTIRAILQRRTWRLLH